MAPNRKKDFGDAAWSGSEALEAAAALDGSQLVGRTFASVRRSAHHTCDTLFESRRLAQAERTFDRSLHILL